MEGCVRRKSNAPTVEDRRRAIDALKDSLRRWWDLNQDLPGEGRTDEFLAELKGWVRTATLVPCDASLPET
jgi:hypothetical protein